MRRRCDSRRLERRGNCRVVAGGAGGAGLGGFAAAGGFNGSSSNASPPVQPTTPTEELRAGARRLFALAARAD